MTKKENKNVYSAIGTEWHASNSAALYIFVCTYLCGDLDRDRARPVGVYVSCQQQPWGGGHDIEVSEGLEVVPAETSGSDTRCAG